jgi:hypothetical protein
MQEIENIGKNSGKYGSISYIKAMIFLVFNLEANNVLLSVNIGTFWSKTTLNSVFNITRKQNVLASSG